MAIRKKNYNSDYMSRKMDEDLEQLEERLTALYTRAVNEVTAEFTDFMSDYEKKYVQMTRLYEYGDITETEYSNWCQRQIIQSDRYKDTVKSLTNTLVKTDVAAMGMVNGQLPLTIAQSYNFVQALGFESTNMPIGVFQIYNANSVQEIIKENPDILPNVDIPEDKKWNKDRINSEIRQGIIQGEPIPKVAQRLQNVTNMDKNAAVRNARTAMTGAENLGRTKSAEDLRNKGIPVKEQWHATMDSRTRDTHLLLDGTFKDEDGYYGASFLSRPLRFPADPLGDPAEIYNCRCREGVVLAGIDHSQDDDLYEKFMKDNYPNDWKAIQESEREQARRTEVSQTKEYQKVLKEIQENGYYSESKPTVEDIKQEESAPSYPVATNWKEATEILKDMGFYDVSNGIQYMNQKVMIETVNKLSELNARFNVIKAGERELKLTISSQRNGMASVGSKIGKVASTELNFNPNFFAMKDTLFTSRIEENVKEGWFMPCLPENYIVNTITHEYGHLLENMIIITPDFTEDLRDWRKRVELTADDIRDEIISIAYEQNPDFDLASNTGDYARKNSFEFFAECFMNSQLGMPNELGNAMNIWLEREGF